MLVEYTFGNYKSFKDQNSLSMLGVKSFKEHEESNVTVKEKFKILKSAVVYGSNAGGKSNLVNGLSAMKRLLMNSFRFALDERNSLNVEKYLLNSKSTEIPSYFEVVFYQKEIRYRYGFEILNEKVEGEWLFYSPIKKEVPLFERDQKEFIINKTSFKEGVEFSDKLRDNVLFISLIAQFKNESISNEVINWFKNVNVINGIQDLQYSRYTYDKFMRDEDFKKWLSSIVQGLEIANIEIEDVDISDRFMLGKNDSIKFSMVSENTNGEIKKHNIKSAKITTWHKRYNENNLLIDAVPFDFLSQESEGTKKFINLLGPWYDTIKNGKVLIIDELDSRLHTCITKYLISIFNNKRNNKSQLIFTSHDVNLLDKELFRRDQIWFVEKDQFGASSLYSLADFKAVGVRNTSSFIRNYVNGKYGALPHIKVNKDMENLIYG
ncbi:MAG: ATP-binding protein [Candidatus Delongbacteria bacterium]|nr:ATP-binding protein [Candidatus Delongbacteria bacterium]